MTEAMHPVLAGFFPTQIQGECEFVQEQVHIRRLSPGEMLYAVGSEADSLYIVLEGRFAVHKPIGIGDRTQVVALLTAGTVLGEAALAADRRRGSTVMAVEQGAVATLSRAALAAMEENAPRLFIGLMKKILSITSLRLRKSSERLALVL